MARISRPAVFLDRDGVIIEDSPSYVRSADQVRLLPAAADGIRRLNDSGLYVVVATNQSALARGLITPADLKSIHDRMRSLLRAASGARVDALYYCPCHPDGIVERYRRDSPCRKPEPGMLVRAAAEHGLSLPDSFMVGDKAIDIEAGHRAGCRTILVLSGPTRIDPETLEHRPWCVAADLAGAARAILDATPRTPHGRKQAYEDGGHPGGGVGEEDRCVW